MFGDIGHGSVLFICAVGLCFFGKQYPALAPMYRARYLLLLMGFFAIFCGLIYNDFLSIPLNLFTSCYNFETGTKLNANCVYSVGVDPVWYISEQEIQFLNSIKMKTAVIFGVLHMTLGILQKGINAAYHKNTLELFHEFFPQIIMLLCLFGYMDLMIIIKWCTNYYG
jgi:V-type H+-transporting ATPase subunit a